MIKNYGKIIMQVENEIFSFIDGFEDEKFTFDGSLTRFRFKTDDNLAYNKRTNIPVCVISLSVFLKKKIFVIQILNYKGIFMKVKVYKL